MNNNRKENKKMIKYYVDEPKRTVAAVLEDCELDAVDVISRKIGYINEYLSSDLSVDKYTLPKRFVGIAKCDPRDTFNETEGKKIAKKRCLDKYHKRLNKTIDRYCVNMMIEAGKIYQSLASDNLFYGCDE
jgi:hypothetical protein